MSEIKVKGKKALMDRIVSKLQATKPRNDAAGTCEVARTSKNILSRVKYVVSTGIKSFDQLTGGLPFGRVVELYGMDASGKTGIAIRTAIRAQSKYIYERLRDTDGAILFSKVPDDTYDVTIFYVDNEQSLDDDGKIQIVDDENPQNPPIRLDAVAYRCDTITQLFKAVDNMLDITEAYEKESGRTQFVVVVVDTIASTSSNEEMTAEWGKVDYQRQPKQLRESFRKMTRRLNRQNVCMICINQVSDSYAASARRGPKSSTPQDDDFSTFGGRALKYYASIRIFMYRMKTRFALRPKASFQQGFIIGFKTTKNRVIKPLREGRMVLMFDKGYLDTYSMLETLMFMKYAEMGETGDIRFRFRAKGITTTTFGKSAASLEEEDDEAGRESDPKISCRAEWTSFYAAHKEDVDNLWDAAMKAAFASEGEPTSAEVISDEEQDDEDFKEEV
jgi:RecA/RadA recombinase